MNYEITQSAYLKGTVFLLSMVNDKEGIAAMWSSHKIDLEPGQKVPLQALRDMFQKEHNKQVRGFIAQAKKHRPKEPRGVKRIMDITQQQLNSGQFS
jgi:hypothetical protein